MNPAAGSGRSARLVPWLRDRLRGDSAAELVVTRAPGHATQLAAEAAAARRDRIVAVGGDGTVQEVVEGLMRSAHRPALGLIPQGSGNDLARGIGIPRRPEEAWPVAVGDGSVALDVGRASADGRTRHFVSSGGIGFDAQVAAAMARRRSWQRGPAGYLLTTLDELRRFRNRRIRITLDDGPAEEHSVLLVAIANGPFYGGGMRICPEARSSDGWLDLCLVGDISRLTALQQLPNLYRGTHVRHPAVSLRRARSIEVEADAGTQLHLDGEPFGAAPLRAEVMPGAVRVAAPLR